MLLLLLGATPSGGPTVCVPAFQADAFQFSGFQLCTTTAVGWPGRPGRFRHTRKQLEDKLRRQQADTFGRRWFEEYLAAERVALARADKAKSAKQREALEAAVEAADAALEEVIEDGRIEELARILNAAASATRVTASIKLARAVVELSSRAAQEASDDDDEAIMLLLH